MGTSQSQSSTMSTEEVTGLTTSADIVVFSSSSCPYCKEAIRALKAAGYEEKMSVIEATSTQRSALRDLTTSSSVPNVWVKGQYVGGCNDGPESWMGIKKMIGSGKLAELLA